MLLTKEEYNDCIDAIKPLLLSGKATTDDYWYKAVCKAQLIKFREWQLEECWNHEHLLIGNQCILRADCSECEVELKKELGL
jgi:hypothetical protein